MIRSPVLSRSVDRLAVVTSSSRKGDPDACNIRYIGHVGAGLESRVAGGQERKRTERAAPSFYLRLPTMPLIFVGESSQAFVVGSPPEKMHAHPRSLSYRT